jgi:hypothetical protein
LGHGVVGRFPSNYLRFSLFCQLVSKRLFCEWIDPAHTEGPEVAHIAGDDTQATHESGSCNKCIFQMVVRSPVSELRPAAKDSGVWNAGLRGKATMISVGQ